jgi:hypothetical protein
VFDFIDSLSKLYRAIQNCSTVQTRLSGEMWKKKNLTDSPSFPSYQVLTSVSLLLLWLSIFTKWNQLVLNMICLLNFLFSIKERNCSYLNIFNRHLRVLPFEYFSNPVVRTCQTCYLYYCPSLLTALQLSVLPETLSTESHSNDHNTEWHQHKWVVTRKGDKSGGKKRYLGLHFLLQVIFPQKKF